MPITITAIFQTLGRINAHSETYGYEPVDRRCCTDTAHWRSAAP